MSDVAELMRTEGKDTDHVILIQQPYDHPQGGHSRHMWDPNVPDEVAQARATFDYFKKKGYLIYRVDEDGDRAEDMKKFDPSASKMIMQPNNVGG